MNINNCNFISKPYGSQVQSGTKQGTKQETFKGVLCDPGVLPFHTTRGKKQTMQNAPMNNEYNM